MYYYSVYYFIYKKNLMQSFSYKINQSNEGIRVNVASRDCSHFSYARLPYDMYVKLESFSAV